MPNPPGPPGDGGGNNSRGLPLEIPVGDPGALQSLRRLARWNPSYAPRVSLVLPFSAAPGICSPWHLGQKTMQRSGQKQGLLGRYFYCHILYPASHILHPASYILHWDYPASSTLHWDHPMPWSRTLGALRGTSLQVKPSLTLDWAARSGRTPGNFHWCHWAGRRVGRIHRDNILLP